MPIIPALQEAEGRSPEVGSSRPAWPTWRNLISTKNTKNIWAWWRAPVVPTAQKAEVGGWLCQAWDAVRHDHATGLQPG